MAEAEGPRLPDALADAVREDLGPVRPHAAPWRRTLGWVPLAVAAFVVLPLVIGVRRDGAVLGTVMTWGLSAVQVVAATLLVWMAAREGVPSRRLPAAWLRWGLAAAGGLVVLFTVATFAASPTHVPPSVSPWTAGSFCYRGSLMAGVPLLCGLGLVLGRAFPVRPWLSGALAGAGAGLAADAGWRLVCPVSDPSHVLLGHTAAVVTLAVAGLVAVGMALRVRRW